MKTALPYWAPVTKVAPLGRWSALKSSASWSRSLALMVNCSGWPITATFGPMVASSGGSEAEVTLTTKVVEADSAAFAPPPSPSSVAVSLTM